MDSLSGTPPRRDQHPLQAYFVDSLHPFRSSIGCVLLLNRMFWKQTMYRSTIPLRFIWSTCTGN